MNLGSRWIRRQALALVFRQRVGSHENVRTVEVGKIE